MDGMARVRVNLPPEPGKSFRGHPGAFQAWSGDSFRSGATGPVASELSARYCEVHNRWYCEVHTPTFRWILGRWTGGLRVFDIRPIEG